MGRGASRPPWMRHCHIPVPPGCSWGCDAALWELEQAHGKARGTHLPVLDTRLGLDQEGGSAIREDPTATSIGGKRVQHPLPCTPRAAGGTLTSGPGSWRGLQRSGAAPGAGPGSSSAPLRPARAERWGLSWMDPALDPS